MRSKKACKRALKKSVRSKKACAQISVRSNKLALKKACTQKSVYSKKRALKKACIQISVRSNKRGLKKACALSKQSSIYQKVDTLFPFFQQNYDIPPDGNGIDGNYIALVKMDAMSRFVGLHAFTATPTLLVLSNVLAKLVLRGAARAAKVGSIRKSLGSMHSSNSSAIANQYNFSQKYCTK